MSARSHARGHDIESTDGLTWRYVDDGSTADVDRPCKGCGLSAVTPDGPDPCVGLIPGAIGACCGHGVHRPYVIYGAND
jgi:hypothetical protein